MTDRRLGARLGARRGAAVLQAAVALALVALLAVACSATLVTNAPLDTGTPVDTGAAGDTDTPAGQVTIDPNLLAVLPRSVDSVPVIESPEGDSDALADDVLPTIATAAVGAVAVDAQAQNLAYALVVRLRPDAMTDAIFQDWRDSYDAGACAGETQVVATASSTVAGHTIYIGTCATGLRTYHVWLKDRGILISISATGTKEWGLVMMGNLRK